MPSRRRLEPFELGQRDVEGRLLVQAARQRLGRGEVAVLEELVARRTAPAERKVTAGFVAQLRAAADLVVEGDKSASGQDRLERVPRHVAQREAAVPRAAEAEKLGRIGREVAVAIHVDDGKRMALLRPHAGLATTGESAAGALE